MPTSATVRISNRIHIAIPVGIIIILLVIVSGPA
jgi:hypothetical protein